MLRVGLTGDLGSGKSTVARMLAERGAVVLSSDEMGRRLMEPGEAVYAGIVQRFGEGVVQADGTLDRGKLAAIAFDPANPRIEELNAIVHPAVIEEQAKALDGLAGTDPEAIVVVESALIFSTKYAVGGTWRARFERIVLVSAPEDQKVARFVDRAAGGRALSGDERKAMEEDARRRLSTQRNEEYSADCVVLHNDGDIEQLEAQVDSLWAELSGSLTS